MAWSPPARQRRSWLVEQAGDYATPISHHTRNGTHDAVVATKLLTIANTIVARYAPWQPELLIRSVAG
jgi:hypothetical protein